MPINDPKTPKPEDLASAFINGFLKGFPTTTTNSTEPVTDPLKETNRLLKKAEGATEEEAAKLLSIADRHIAVLDIAISSQK